MTSCLILDVPWIRVFKYAVAGGGGSEWLSGLCERISDN